MVKKESNICTVCNSASEPTAGLQYAISSDGTGVEVVDYTGTSKTVVIAGSYENVPVKFICADAFDDTFVKALCVPTTITSIEASAFADCHDLQGVYIGDLAAAAEYLRTTYSNYYWSCL